MSEQTKEILTRIEQINRLIRVVDHTVFTQAGLTLTSALMYTDTTNVYDIYINIHQKTLNIKHALRSVLTT